MIKNAMNTGINPYISPQSLYSFSASIENEKESEVVIEYINNLKYKDKREECLQELAKRKDSFPKMAIYLWHSVGTVAIL